MPRHTEHRYLPYTPEQLFELVADVKRYDEFLPWVGVPGGRIAVVHGRPESGENQLVLPGPAPIDGAEPHAGRGGHVLHAQSVVTDLLEQGERPIEDHFVQFRPGWPTAGWGTHRNTVTFISGNLRFCKRGGA